MTKREHRDNTIPDKAWESIQHRGIRHQIAHEGGVFGDAAARRSKAHDPKKAESN